MDRWTGKVALVTGSAGGIGLAIAKSLVEQGVRVVGLDIQLDKLQELARDLGKSKFYPVQCDVSKENDILRAFKWAEEKLGGVDILVNNAGIAILTMVIDVPTKDLNKIVDINLIAPTIFAREFMNGIRNRNGSGHIVNISSLAGRYPETCRSPLGLYPVVKSGVYALSMELRHEIVACNLDIRVTNISPGMVLTDMLKKILNCGDEIREKITLLSTENIAQAVISAIGAPAGAEIFNITIVPQNIILGGPVAQLDNLN